MLVLKAQSASKEPEWFEIIHKGETLRFFASKKRTVLKKCKDNGVYVFFESNENFKINRTGEYVDVEK